MQKLLYFFKFNDLRRWNNLLGDNFLSVKIKEHCPLNLNVWLSRSSINKTNHYSSCLSWNSFHFFSPNSNKIGSKALHLSQQKQHTRFRECHTSFGCETRTGVVLILVIFDDRLMISHHFKGLVRSFPWMWLNIDLGWKITKILPPF